MTENLVLLGSTGSIGEQSLDVCRKCGAPLADVEAPAEGSSAGRGMVRGLRVSAVITFVVCFVTGIITFGGYELGLPQLSWVAGLSLGMLQLGLAEALELLRKLRDGTPK